MREPGWVLVCADYDNDGDTDVFVGNDEMENYLFENDGSGTFAEVALLQGTAYDATGKAQGSMGVDCGDFNNDGWLDFFVTTYQDEPPALYQNSGNDYFEDVTLATHVGVAATPNVNWGTGFVDFDLDGDRDIFMACGHMEDNIQLASDAWEYLARNILLLNTGDGKFVDVSATSGDGMAVKLSSRGAGFDDLDNDGDIDAVIVNSRRESTILRNESETGNHWLQIRLQGVKTNRDGIGAHVRVVAGDLVQIDEVHSGRGYQSHYGMRLHFGLGKHDRVDRVEVRWIGGGLDVLRKRRRGPTRDDHRREQKTRRIAVASRAPASQAINVDFVRELPRLVGWPSKPSVPWKADYDCFGQVLLFCRS